MYIHIQWFSNKFRHRRRERKWKGRCKRKEGSNKKEKEINFSSRVHSQRLEVWKLRNTKRRNFCRKLDTDEFSVKERQVFKMLDLSRQAFGALNKPFSKIWDPTPPGNQHRVIGRLQRCSSFVRLLAAALWMSWKL